MNEYQELTIRTIGVFSSVFFTVSWAMKSSIPRGELFAVGVITSVIIAIYLR